MKKRIFYWQLAGVIFTIAFGVLLHFVYDWSNESIFVASFSAVNESIWEHMKILFFPMFLFSIIESFFFDNYKNYWLIKLKGILIGIVLIPLIYLMLYNGANFSANLFALTQL